MMTSNEAVASLSQANDLFLSLGAVCFLFPKAKFELPGTAERRAVGLEQHRIDAKVLPIGCLEEGKPCWRKLMLDF